MLFITRRSITPLIRFRQIIYNYLNLTNRKKKDP
nr:MAG TPA: hypothetical protein [Caudoviricetes sp.]